MDKFSLYEILSFFIPGYLLVSVIGLYNEYVFENPPFINLDSKIEESFLLLSIAFFAGVIVHYSTFKLLDWKSFAWYKKIVFKDIDEVVKSSSHMAQLIPFLKKHHKSVVKHKDIDKAKDVLLGEVFDLAYYYLEVNNKITPAKSFQSLYFWFRNMLSIAIGILLCSFLLLLYFFFFENNEFVISSTLKISLISIVFIAVTIKPMQWLRKKMLIKIFWSYYSEIIFEKTK